MGKNGHDRLERQRWMCPGCRTTGTTRDLPGRHRVLAYEWACYMKSAKPEPGTSIEWTDLHMPVFNT